MLVLTRDPGQSIQIGNDIRVTVLKDPSGHIRLGIDAPREMKVLRSELLDRERGKPDNKPHTPAKTPA